VTLVYGSVCSGIGADAAAWHPLGWTCAFQSEIAPFPSRVLAHHYPNVPNLGDFTKITEAQSAGIDLLMGGTPCQDFSVAGLRAGMDGDRGSLSLEFLRLAARARPRWIVWENVPGVLSSDGGRALGAFAGGLAELGYGFAWRVLDAQHFGVAQRRRRVFLVGHDRGLWQRAAAVLFDAASMRRDSAPVRKARADVAGCLEGRARSGGHDPGAHGAATGHIVAQTLTTREGRHHDASLETLIPFDSTQIAGTAVAPMVVQEDNQNGVTVRDKAGSLRSNAPGTAPCGSLLLIPFDSTQITSATNRSRPEAGDPAPTLGKTSHAPAIAFHRQQDPISGAVSPALGRKTEGMGVFESARVRRLTPRECERLMGFADDYTAIPGAKDGPRYAALGNSIAVPVLRWIGERIAYVDGLE